MRSQQAMIEVVAWLKRIEQMAADLYAQVSRAVAHDQDLSRFLDGLAEDERSHAEIMECIARHIEAEKTIPASEISLDEATRRRVESPLTGLQRQIAGEDVSKPVLIQLVAQAETSEWNDIFLYVVDKFREETREFQSMVAEIQGHQFRVRDFVANLPEELKPSLDVSALPPVWQSKFLVVEDHAEFRRTLASILRRKGVVETAGDGREGLEKTKEHFFNAIVSDISMPVMSGFEFYEKALECDPQIGDRFLLCSLDAPPIAFLEQHPHVRFIEKPFALGEFLQVLDDIVRKSYENIRTN